MSRAALKLGVLLVAPFVAAAAVADDPMGQMVASLMDPVAPGSNGYEVMGETIRIVTAYNVGDPDQNAGDPCISANGENICEALEKGLRRCAANFVPFGTRLHIDSCGTFVVTDRTHSRYRNRVDIAMKSDEVEKAKAFGKKRLTVKIVK